MDGLGGVVVSIGVAFSFVRLLPRFVWFVQRFPHLILPFQVDFVVGLENGDHHRHSVSRIRLSHIECQHQLCLSHYALCCALRLMRIEKG